MSFTQVVPVLVLVLGSGGILGFIIALLKLRPEAGQVVVTAAQGALVVQSGVIETLREDLAESRLENERLRKRVSALELEIETLRAEVHRKN